MRSRSRTVSWPGLRLAHAVLPGALRHASEAEALRSSHRDRRRWQMEVRNALLEGGNGR